jgi:GNAT superfamily N-acetyltransferase
MDLETHEPDFPGDIVFCSLRFAEQTIRIQDVEPSAYIKPWSGMVEWDDLDSGPVLDIGAFCGYLVNVDGATADRVSRFDVFDNEQNTFDIFSALFDPEMEWLKDSVEDLAFGAAGPPVTENVLVIDRLVIYPEYRGGDVGLQVMRELIRHFRSAVGLVVIKPYPLQFEADGGPSFEPLAGRERKDWDLAQFKGRRTSSTARLKRHYALLGFRHVPKTCYMVRSA